MLSNNSPSAAPSQGRTGGGLPPGLVL